MNRSLLAAATVTLGLAGAGAALADNRCDVPVAEWRPREAFQQKLEADGWKVGRIKVDDGCYEVHGFDDKGRRVEAQFDPKTFEQVKLEVED